MKRLKSLALLSLLLPSQALALSASELQQVQYDAVYYSANSTRGAGSVCSAASTLTGSDNPQRAFNFFVGKGVLQPFQAAGIVGNLMEEGGGVDPTSVESGPQTDYPTDGIGFGIAQWTYTVRQQPLVDLAKSQNVLPNTLPVQLDYMWMELTGIKPASDYKGALTAIQATSNIVDATTSFMNTYERPDAKVAHLDRRIASAQDILAKYGGGAPSGSTGSGGCVGGGKVVQIALAEVGTHEDNGNDGGAACKYQGSGCPQAWCADFVSWVFKQAGSSFTGGEDGGWRIAGAAALADWFKNNAVWINNPGHPLPANDPNAPKPGDVVYYPSGDGHVNIVVSYDGTTIKTVGGNQADAVTVGSYDVFGSAAGWGRLK